MLQTKESQAWSDGWDKLGAAEIWYTKVLPWNSDEFPRYEVQILGHCPAQLNLCFAFRFWSISHYGIFMFKICRFEMDRFPVHIQSSCI